MLDSAEEFGALVPAGTGVRRGDRGHGARQRAPAAGCGHGRRRRRNRRRECVGRMRGGRRVRPVPGGPRLRRQRAPAVRVLGQRRLRDRSVLRRSDRDLRAAGSPGATNQGCTNAWTVWEEIVPLGYQGSYQRVRAYFREKRLSPGPVRARPPSPRVVAGGSSAGPRPSPRPSTFDSKPCWSTAPNSMLSPATSAPLGRCSPSARANGCRSGSTPSGETTSPASTPWPQASTVTATRSLPASHCPGIPASSKDTSTGSRCSNARCSTGPASLYCGRGCFWPADYSHP